MSSESMKSEPVSTSWSAMQVYVMGAICLMLGLALGYLFRGSQTQPGTGSAPSQTAPPMQAGVPQQMPSLDKMRQMADTKAAPLLDQLKTDPNNADLLKQVAKIYLATHQFKEAANYYGKVVEINPKDVATRTQMASCLYYSGDVDGAINQLQKSLEYDPKDANSLFNLGMIKWEGRQDAKGALEAWRLLLKTNPELSPERKAKVQRMMADVEQQGKS